MYSNLYSLDMRTVQFLHRLCFFLNQPFKTLSLSHRWVSKGEGEGRSYGPALLSESKKTTFELDNFGCSVGSFFSFSFWLWSHGSKENVRCMKRFLFKSKGLHSVLFFFNLKMDTIERGPIYGKLQLNGRSLSMAGFKLPWRWWIAHFIWHVLLFLCILLLALDWLKSFGGTLRNIKYGGYPLSLWEVMTHGYKVIEKQWNSVIFGCQKWLLKGVKWQESEMIMSRASFSSLGAGRRSKPSASSC